MSKRPIFTAVLLATMAATAASAQLLGGSGGPLGGLTGPVGPIGDIENTVDRTIGNVTGQSQCTQPGHSPLEGDLSCYTRFFEYHIDEDPLDPRNDVLTGSADARAEDINDTTYRTNRTLDDKGRPLTITYPKPAGQATNPTETFTYTTGSGGVPAGLLATQVPF